MSNQKIYIVTCNPDKINYRASKLLELEDQFDVTLICWKSKKYNKDKDNILLIKSRLNIFSAFKKIGLNRISNFLNRKFYFPGPGILYVKNVTKYLKATISKHPNIRYVVITICPPHFVALIGCNLKKEFPSVKWINDLQDLWTLDDYYFNRLSDRQKVKALQVEKELFERADRTIVTNEYAQDFCHKQFHLEENKISYIYHPFDAFNFETNNYRETLIERIRKKEKVSLAFVGGLFKEPKVPGNILLDELRRFVKESNWSLELNVIGSAVPMEYRNDCNKNFTINEYLKLTHLEAYKLAAESDFLIILLGDVPNSKVIMHGKYSHYLALGRCILAFVPPDSFIQKSLNSTNSGFFIDIGSDIVQSLNSIFDYISKNGLPERNIPEIEKYSSSNFKKEWSNLINKTK